MTAWMLLLTLLLLVANGFFVAMEFALIAARRSRIESLANDGDRRAVTALKSIRELSLMLAGAQLGITMASLGLGAISEPAVASLLESALHDAVPERLLHPISFVIALTIIVFFHMVIGEMAPKNVAIARPEGSALWMAYPARIYVNIFRPFIRFLNSLANGTLRLLGVEPKDELLSVHSLEEIGAMVQQSARGGVLHEFETRLLTGATSFGEKDAADAMVPRTEMVALPLDVSPAEAEQKLIETGHTRFPIYIESQDRITGFFHSKDLLKIPETQREGRIPRRLIRPLLVVPESRKLPELLFDMRRERKHFALVIDEHGGTAGIVTLEDVLEELVGEILDEYDAGEAGIERLGNHRYVVPGSLRIDELDERLDIELPEGPYETVAGYLMSELGRIPVQGDTVTHNGWNLQVRSMQARRIEEIYIDRAHGAPPIEPAGSTSEND